MNKIRKVVFVTSALLLCMLTGCSIEQTAESVTESTVEVETTEAQDTEKAGIPEGAIADESGDFIYTGKLQQVGDDENGYIQVPLGYVPFEEEGVDGLMQYSDVTGTNIITLDYYDGVDYETAANNLYYYMSEEDGIEGLSGAQVTVAGYTALQIYCHYTDGVFLVIWVIQNPADTSSSYYMAIEFESDDSDIMACSSTFRTVEDYYAAEQN
jgi:hypothetical protein